MVNMLGCYEKVFGWMLVCMKSVCDKQQKQDKNMIISSIIG